VSRPTLWSALVGCIIGVGIGWVVATERPLTALSSTSPEGAAKRVREILSDTDALRRAEQLASLLPRLGPDSIPAVTAVFDKAPINRGDIELALVGSWWGRLDPEAAWNWTRADWRAEHTVVMSAVARAWAHKDPETAIGHAAVVPYRSQARLIVAAAMAGWEESGRPGLVEYVLATPDVVLRQKLAESLAERKALLLGAGPALEWAQALPHSQRIIMVPRVASAVAESEPKIAATWAEPQIAAGVSSRPTGLARRIATRWVKHDPEAAMAWLASLPAGTDRDDGVIESIRTWVQRENFRARMWIEGLEPARWNEPIRGFYARSVIGNTQPEHALEIVSQFEDVENRNYLTTVIARYWLVRDRAAAEAWLKRADIPPDVRKRAYMTPRDVQPRELDTPPVGDGDGEGWSD